MSYAHVKAYRQRRVVRARVHLGGTCVVCGSTQSLHFDHVDPESKTIEIATAIAQGWAWVRLVVELDKCQLLCQTHHIEKSRAEGSFGGVPWNKGRHHGTFHGAYHVKCECDECKQYKVERNAARRARRGASGGRNLPDKKA